MLQNTIPSYLYQQYADDDALQAFVASYNQMTQNYVSAFNGLNLPVYTQGPPISGAVLDWVAAGLYGVTRPTLAFSTNYVIEAFNTFQLDQIEIDGRLVNATSTLYPVTDDLFCRILTWNLFKGDGRVFSAKWLKKRIVRFLTGTNGAPLMVADTSSVSVAYGASGAITVTVTPGGAISPSSIGILAAAVQQGVCQLPFPYTYTILA